MRLLQALHSTIRTSIYVWLLHFYKVPFGLDHIYVNRVDTSTATSAEQPFAILTPEPSQVAY